MDNRIKLLNKIIDEENLSIVFQPIVSLKNGEVLGYEALSRIPSKANFESIEELFSVANESNQLWELEYLSRKKTLEAAKEFMVAPFSKKLFLNVSPEIVNDKKFHVEIAEFFLKEFQISPHNIIFELTEKNIINNFQGLQSTLSQYKSDQFKLAVDDAGVEFTGLSAVTDFNPHYIKIDMKLIRNIDRGSLRSALVKGMVEYSKIANISLIAEGVETYEELETIAKLGVQYAQGYYIQKPSDEIISIDPEVIRQILTIRAIMIQDERNRVQFTPIKELSLSSQTISPDMLTIDAYELMNSDINCFGLTIVEDGQPIGIITKESLGLTLSGRYGFTLYQNKPVSKIMDQEFLSVDHLMPVNIVSDLAMDRPQNKLYDFVVVTENDQFHGTVTIKRMLQKATELEVSSARQQSPLTGLPGNFAIEQKMSNLLKDEQEFCAVYLDIDHFKAYNDVYGFETGDLIIKLLAKILTDSVPEDQFVGHIGGDDFIVLLNHYIPEEVLDKVVNTFETEVLSFYSSEDREKGYITTKSRYGEIENFPLISVTAVKVENHEYEFNNTTQISEQLAVLKNRAKQAKSRLRKARLNREEE